jgi:preprotein translocase subunit SecD
MHITVKDKHRLTVKGRKKIVQINGVQKQARVAILISNKADFKTKLVKRDKEGHFTLRNNPSREFNN